MSKQFPLCCYIYYSNRIEPEPPERCVPLHRNLPEFEQPTSRYTVSKEMLHTWGLLRTFFPVLLPWLTTRA